MPSDSRFLDPARKRVQVYLDMYSYFACLSIVSLFSVLPSYGDLTADSEFSVNVDGNMPKSESFRAPTKVYGFYEVVPTGQTEMVWQSPERVGYGQSVAVLFMAHGCSHAATDFFDQSPSCRECIGLPVERRLVQAALKRGFFVVAVSSKDRIGSKYDMMIAMNFVEKNCFLFLFSSITISLGEYRPKRGKYSPSDTF